MKHRFQFRLRTLLLIAASSAVVLGLVRNAIVGRLVVVERGELSTYEPCVSFKLGTPLAAKRFQVSFNKQRFVERVTQDIQVALPLAEDALESFSVQTHVHEDYCEVRYSITYWARSRFDLGKLKFIHDLDDPVARNRNLGIEESIAAIAKSIAKENPSIKGLYDWPLSFYLSLKRAP